MSWVKDEAKMPIDAFTHSDPLAEAVTGNDITLNPDRSFRSSLAAGYNDDRLAQSAGIGQNDYMHGGEAVAAIVGAIFGGAALAGAGGGGGAGAGAAAEGGGATGAATAGGGTAAAAEGGGSAVIGDVGAGEAAGATGVSLTDSAGAGAAGGSTAAAGGDAGAGAAAEGGGDAGAATASGGAGSSGSGFSLGNALTTAHKIAPYVSAFNAVMSAAKAKQGAVGMQQAGAPPLPPTAQDSTAPDMSAIRKKNSLLFGDDSPSTTDHTKGSADTGNLGKVSLLGGTKKLGS